VKRERGCGRLKETSRVSQLYKVRVNSEHETNNSEDFRRIHWNLGFSELGSHHKMRKQSAIIIVVHVLLLQEAQSYRSVIMVHQD
jgi:hypothetical protein